MRRCVLALAGVLACAAPSAAAAAGAPDARVSPTVPFPDRELVVALPAKRALTDSRVTVRENGIRVPGVRVTSAADDPRRGVVLAIDTSMTMGGDPIEQAMSAARAFARRRAEHTPLGVVFFSGTPRLALAPTTDARKIDAALAVPPDLSRGTRIFDAASAGITALRRAGMTSGVVVVLSDGAEAVHGSTTTPAALAAQARRADVRIFSVGLNSFSFDGAALRTLASSTGGRYGEAARPRDLPPLFAAIGERLSSEYLVDYRSRRPVGARVAVRVDIAGESAPALAGYRAPRLSFAGAPRGHAASSGGLGTTPITLLALLAFGLVAGILYALLRPERRSVVTRVGDFAGVPVEARPTLKDVKAERERPAREPSELWRRYAEAVELSGMSVGPQPLALWTAAGAVLVWLWAVAGLGRPALGILALAVPFAVRAVVVQRLGARRRAYEEQLPDNLQVMASALRAGYSFSGALAAMAEDAAEPSRSELRRAAADEQLGVELSECLRGVATRMKNPETEYVGIVAQMQREAGGNTAEVLEHVIATTRERLRLRRMVRTLTAQGRLGGGVITAVPIVMAFAMVALKPGYFDPMFQKPLGVLLFLIGGLLIGIGWLAIRKIVDVEA